MATEEAKPCEHCGSPIFKSNYQPYRFRAIRFCSTACGSRSRHKTADEIFDMMAAKHPDPDGCWGWNGHFIKGYANMTVSGKGIRGSRHSYERYVGAIPSGMVICHRCDNPACCNPRHLFPGSSGDNSLDMVRKRRQSHGERSPHAKLTRDQAMDILTSGEDSKIAAARYGVSRNTVYAIRSGANWPSLRT